MQLTGNTSLITGGTSGISRGLAEALHGRGNKVIVAGRRQQNLDEITTVHPDIHGVPLDIEDPLAIDAFTAMIQTAFPEMNVLINNAGISRSQDLTDDSADFSVTRSVIETNIIGTLQLTAALLPTLKRQPRVVSALVVETRTFDGVPEVATGLAG